MTAEHGPVMESPDAHRGPQPADEEAVMMGVKAAFKRQSTELTPLVIKHPPQPLQQHYSRRSHNQLQQKTFEEREEVHPLPWFRSPEARRSPVRVVSQRKGSKRFAPKDYSDESWCMRLLRSCSDTDSVNVELGDHRVVTVTTTSDLGSVESDSMRRCVQMLVGMILLLAVALLLLIIFQPFQQPDAVSS